MYNSNELIFFFFYAQRRVSILLNFVKQGRQIWQWPSKQKEWATDFENKIANDQRGTFLNVITGLSGNNATIVLSLQRWYKL